MNITSYDLGNNVKRFVLKKDDNFEVHILNLGCIIEKIIYYSQNMVLSYSDYNSYYNNGSYMGAIVGRTSGRIDKASYILNGKKYQLEVSEPDRNTNLHGGINGYSNKIFDTRVENNKLILEYTDDNKIYDSIAYIKAIYYLDEDTNSLNVEYIAKSDKDSYINLTNHTYFNLGSIDKDILNHAIKINADYYWKVKENLTANKRESVDNTIFDFRKKMRIGENINVKNEQFDYTYYYDHAFELNKKYDYDIILENLDNNISMILTTNQAFTVMYAGNFLHEVENVTGVSKNVRHLGVALEAQNLPNGINIGDEYYEITNKDNVYINKIKYTFIGGN